MPARSSARAPRHRTRSRDVRQVLLEAGTALLEEEGLTAVTIRAVAARSGSAPQSVYNHFGDKQGLLAAIAEDHFSALATALTRITEADPVERLRRAGEVVHDLMTAHPRSYELMWAVTPGPATRDAFGQLVHLVQYGQAAGAFVAGDAVSLASAVWAAIQGAISTEVHQGQAVDDAAGVSTIDFPLVLEVILRGVCVR